MFITGDGNNRTGWSNPRYDELIAAAAREPDRDKRASKSFAEAERILDLEGRADLSALSITSASSFTTATRLGGIESNVLDEHPLKNIYWKKR